MEETLLTAHQKEVLRKAIVDTARKLIGVPYHFGAEWNDYSKFPLELPIELDCSEMVEGVYRINGFKMPDGAQNQFNFTVPAASPADGDLLFFGKGGKTEEIYHVGILANTAVIEARGHQSESSFETGKVIVRPLIAWQNYKNFVGIRSHPKLA